MSVSNDGITFSEEDVLVIYDSTCVNCSVDESAASTCVVNVRTNIKNVFSSHFKCQYKSLF